VRWALAPHGFVALIASGVAMVLVFACVWVFFVYRGDPYLDLRGLVAQRFAAFAGRRA